MICPQWNAVALKRTISLRLWLIKRTDNIAFGNVTAITISKLIAVITSR